MINFFLAAHVKLLVTHSLDTIEHIMFQKKPYSE